MVQDGRGASQDGGSFQPIVGREFTFDLLFFLDVGGRPSGTPLDPMPGTTIARRTVSITGTDIGLGSFLPNFQASFDPVSLEGERTYWLVIAAAGDFTFNEITNRSGSF